MTNPQSDPKLLHEAAVLGGLADVYVSACTDKDYKLCDRIRATIQMHLAGKKAFITIESGLNLPPSIW